MFIKSADKVIDSINGQGVVVVGAGINGKEFSNRLVKRNKTMLCFFDNGDYGNNRIINGYRILKPYKIAENVIYVICVKKEHRGDLFEQLLNIGIGKNDIRIYYPEREIDYIKSLKTEEYQEEISDMYYEVFGRQMDWDKPVTYNEIINWEKLYSKDIRRERLADKYRVREWVKEKIGDKYLTRVYGSWEKPEDIKPDFLPDQCVLKMNNASGRNIFISNKGDADWENIRFVLQGWFDNPFGIKDFELHYSKIEPLVYCEEFLNGNAEFIDVKYYCFRGIPRYVHVIRNEHTDISTARFYDMNWIPQEFNHFYKNDNRLMAKPKWFDEITEKTYALCRDFDHVRVDWFCLPNNLIYFSEMTFTSNCGFCHFYPEKYDELFGKMVRGEF